MTGSFITAIEPVPSQPHRCQVLVDGEVAITVHQEVILKFGLTEGCVWDEHLHRQLLQEEAFIQAKTCAYRYLAASWRTTGEVRRHLSRQGFSEAVVRLVLEHCRRQGYLDDRIYAEQYIARRLQRGYGPLRIAQELSDKGIDHAIYEPILSSLDPDELFQLAKRMAAKKEKSLGRQLSPRDKRAKIGRHLYYRGYSQSVIQKVLNLLFS